MRSTLCLALIAALAAVATVSSVTAAAWTRPLAPSAPAVQVNPATTPVARPDAWWQQCHTAMNERVKQGKVDLVFIGDSITQAWDDTGAALWAKRFAPRNAVNLGISGDQTEHVLWRLQNGNLAGITPKAAVIMIGTNNVGNTGGSHSAEQIAAGVQAIVDELGKKTPTTKVLLLAIFPRAEPTDPMREKITAINASLAKFAKLANAAAPKGGERVTFLDVGPKFLAADGTLPKELMPDLLHLSAKGYEIWADAIEADLKKLLGEK
ncbi:MAG: GDSL family lipase [Myxococcales bacterium]|nr:GDSL family lipase [Myxococcales bacterium]